MGTRRAEARLVWTLEAQPSSSSSSSRPSSYILNWSRRLMKAVHSVQKYSLALNTSATYLTTAFLRFATYFSMECAPPDDVALAAFIVFQAQTCSFRSLKVYLAGIRHWVLCGDGTSYRGQGGTQSIAR